MTDEFTKISWQKIEAGDLETVTSLTLDGDTIVMECGETDAGEVKISDVIALSKSDVVLLIKALQFMVQEM